MYRIPRIDCNVACPASLEEAFARTVRETVACNNWPADFPYAPQVGFRIFHTGADLLRGRRRGTLYGGRTLDDNGPVWTDSCAEFFFRPEGSDSYYNFECNCIGTLLVGTGATARRRNMPLPKCCAPCGDARPIRTLRCRKPKATTAGR